MEVAIKQVYKEENERAKQSSDNQPPG